MRNISLLFKLNASVLSLAVMFVTLSGIPLMAAVTLPWSSTYNCPEWTQGQALNCDGISPKGDWTTSAGSREQITTGANYSGGGGGRGQRQWNGDGQNNNSGGTIITWTTVEPELWVRWYMRYEQGYTWYPLSYDKWLYFDQGSNHYGLVEGYTYSDQNRFLSNYGTYGIGTSGNGWNTIMVNGGTDANGNKTSDGQWHCYEVHIKMDSGNATNGEGDIWIDGVLRMSSRGVLNFSGTSGATGWTSTLIGSNQAIPANGRDVYVDFDDIAVSATGRINCLGGDTTAPTQPTNLSATTQSATQINLTWTASTDAVGVTSYTIERCAGSGCTNFLQVGTVTGTPPTAAYNDTGLTGSTLYRYRVKALDAAANTSTASSVAEATTQASTDTTPPSTPTNLSANVISSVRIDLTWSVSTDNVGVTSYLIERCTGTGCTTFVQSGTVTGNPPTAAYSDTGLIGNTTYSYRIKAVDGAPNTSGASSIVSATTQTDTTPPSKPTNPRVN